MIETGRHISIPRQYRFWPLCFDKIIFIIEDKFHFFYECPTYDDLRNIYCLRILDKQQESRQIVCIIKYKYPGWSIQYGNIHSGRNQTKKRDSFNILILSQLHMSVL